MKISYNWLKWYIPEAPTTERLIDVFNYHLCEVESVEHRVLNKEEDWIFDLKILPNRAHDLLSHQGIARELASLLNIKYVDPASKYKIPESKPTNLKIKIKSENCRRYMGRIVRNVKVDSSPDWIVKHLESIGQRSINNIVDAANIMMFDCGQPAHILDLNKLAEEGLIIRQAKDGEQMTTLDNKEVKLGSSDMIIADSKNVLGVAGVKGGRIAEVDENTKNIIIEVANFDPVSLRKTGQALNIFTDARKRFENDLSPELASYAMREISALILEMCPEAIFENVVDVYPKKQEVKRLSFSADRISKILGVKVSVREIKDILKRYNFTYNLSSNPSPDRRGAGGEVIEVVIPPMRLDLMIEEDMAEEIGRILGYDKVKGNIPKINFQPKVNEIYAKILWARNKLLADGYSEVMTYTFCDKGEVEVQNSASDKKFLRTNLSDGLKESIKLNQINAPFLGIDEIKIFEIGTVFRKNGEEIHIAYGPARNAFSIADAGGDKKNITEVSLNDFCKDMPSDNSPLEEYPLGGGGQFIHPGASATPQEGNNFKIWSLFPFIARDVAVFVPDGIKSVELEKIIKENMGNMVIRGPELFDEFKKPASPAGRDGKVSYAFRLVFQSYDRTLTDAEVNEIITKITNKIKENKGWQVR